MDEFGGIDLLANVAGMQQAVPDITELTTEQFDDTFKTDVYGMFWLCRAAVGQMQPGSAIINTTSVNTYRPSPLLLDYASTKGAINVFTKSLAQQIAAKGIRVNAVAPGPVWTPLQVSGGQPTEALAQYGGQTPDRTARATSRTGTRIRLPRQPGGQLRQRRNALRHRGMPTP